MVADLDQKRETTRLSPLRVETCTTPCNLECPLRHFDCRKLPVRFRPNPVVGRGRRMPDLGPQAAKPAGYHASDFDH